MAENPLFRKSALDKLASPERLDVLMQVTSPQGWIALLTIALVLAGAIGWSVFGRIGERVNGHGMLIRGDGNRLIRADGAGRLENLRVKTGEPVAPRNVIANIKAESVKDTVDIARTTYDSQRAENERRKTEDQIKVNSINQQALDLESARQKTEATLTAKRAHLVERRKMLADKLISNRDVDADEQEVAGLERDALNLSQQIATLRSNATAVMQGIRGGDSAVADSLLRLNEMKKSATSVFNVTSAFTGRIMALPKREGDVVQKDDIIAAVEETAAPLQAAIFVSDLEGPRIKKGMPVQLDMTPTVRREQYGVLLGTVSSVGQYAATPEEVLSIIANDSQSAEILKSGSKFLVRVTLVQNPATPTGLGWSSSLGPTQPMAGGMTVSSGAIIVESRRPLCRVLPIDSMCAS
jgi:HlyD family secretion protein